MGFLDNLFGRSATNADQESSGAVATLTCDTCGSEVDEDEMEDGQCEECYNSEYSGPKYCCGVIYEDGEDTCRSCDESL